MCPAGADNVVAVTLAGLLKLVAVHRIPPQIKMGLRFLGRGA